MNERPTDFALLRDFALQGRQAAFTTLTRRHLDLVYATALRKVGDSGGAEEIAQNVFSTLARKAWQFAPDDSLPAWLHKTALLESKFWLRGELRRRRREQTAAELGTTMNTPQDQPAFAALVPLLDDALLSLREQDRTALLLRYYESQSLREVGAAFGVSDDTAQKRVQGALEKLAGFFKRRGFRTATVAAAAAALEHTAAPASAALAGTVVSAALSAAPPALTGLGALLARLASFSRVQTAAVCVVLAAVPLGWQLKERHIAGEAAKRMQRQLLAAQDEGATLQTDIERLRASAGRLEQSVAQANEAAARAAESARAFDAWKKKTRGLLTAADYRWDDDSPFVRIRKAILPELSRFSNAEQFAPPGVVRPYVRELLGLTPAESQALEATLQRHVADAERGREAGIYETNNNTSIGSKFTSAGGVVLATKVFGLPELSEDEVKQRSDQLLAEIRGILGEERWPLIQAKFKNIYAHFGDVHLGGDVLRPLAVEVSAQKVELSVGTDARGMPGWFGLFSGASRGGYCQGALSAFLPEGDPNRTSGADDFLGGVVSKALRERAVTWLQEQATARLAKEAKP